MSCESTNDALQAKYEDALRQALVNANRVRELEDAFYDYLLWPPNRKGHAAALRALCAVVMADTTNQEDR